MAWTAGIQLCGGGAAGAPARAVRPCGGRRGVPRVARRGLPSGCHVPRRCGTACCLPVARPGEAASQRGGRALQGGAAGSPGGVAWRGGAVARGVRPCGGGGAAPSSGGHARPCGWRRLVGDSCLAIRFAAFSPLFFCFFFFFSCHSGRCSRGYGASGGWRSRRADAAKPRLARPMAGAERGQGGAWPCMAAGVETPSIGVRRRLQVGDDGIHRKSQKQNERDARNSIL